MSGLAFLAAGIVSSSLGAAFNENLVKNPSFEAFTAQTNGPLSVGGLAGKYNLGDWITTGTLTLDRYDGSFGPTTGTPAGAGVYYLFGTASASSTVEQDCDLSFAAAEIAAGQTTFQLSAFLGSWKIDGTVPSPTPQDDIATLTLTFLDTVNAVISTTSIVGPNYPVEVGAPLVNGNFQAFFARAGAVPPTAVKAHVSVLLRRDPNAIASNFNNANADMVNLSLFAPPACPGDLTGDGQVNTTDLAKLLSAYGVHGSNLAQDINHDGVVNTLDLAALLGHFGATCT